MKMKVSREETNLVVVRCVQSYIFFLFNDKISIKKTLIRPNCLACALGCRFLCGLVAPPLRRKPLRVTP